MAYIMRPTPYWRNQYDLERAINRFFDLDTEPLPSSFPLDVIEKDKEYVVKASAPGFDPEKIEITYEDNTLSIRGEIEEENEESEEGKYHIRERSYGSFYRSISMPGVIDPDKISAETDNGILVIHLPKKPETQRKRIAITGKERKKIVGPKE